ncbi:putative DNA recombinase [Alicyclobacillus acidoterrestris]|uniref:recombinase family protein n=1 Tax=Alicyclobacillus suci TaxID=2816080 RepID=UPI001190E33C|nr:recombinase family protein [Alicyclobacillus suci]GEO25568.1 putative DNA recombinase [Alicyclobacillus acidoterrestris]
MRLLKAAVYIRVSTGAQATDGHSLDVQLEQCMEQAKRLGIAAEDVEVYREAGASGEDMDRPALTRLLDAAAEGRLSHVIVKHPDRLSRNMADKAIIVRLLKQHHIDIVFVDVPNWDQSDEAHLLFNIISSIAEYELRQIRRRTLSGKLRAAREGQIMPMGIDPYGYRYESGKLVIDETEAAYVRQIFAWYVDERLSMRQIARRLDECGAPTKTRKALTWSHATVAHILRNEMYVGRYTYNRRRTKKERGAVARGRLRVRRVIGWHPKTDWIVYPVPRIVDDATFERARQRRQAAHRQGSRRNTYQHLLQGKLRCRLCHRMWHVAASRTKRDGDLRYYRRPAEKSGAARQCSYRCRAIRAKAIERAVFGELVKRLLASQMWKEVTLDDTGLHARRILDDIQWSQTQYEQLVQRLQRLQNLYVTGDLSQVEYERHAQLLRQQQARAAARTVHLQSVLQQTESARRRALEEVMQMFLTGDERIPFAIRRQMVCSFVDECLIDASDDAVDVLITGPMVQLTQAQSMS